MCNICGDHFFYGLLEIKMKIELHFQYKYKMVSQMCTWTLFQIP